MDDRLIAHLINMIFIGICSLAAMWFVWEIIAKDKVDALGKFLHSAPFPVIGVGMLFTLSSLILSQHEVPSEMWLLSTNVLSAVLGYELGAKKKDDPPSAPTKNGTPSA